MPRLILWDIDGTLVRGGQAATAAFDRALRAVYRIAGDLARIDTAGKTDWQITLETLARHNITAAEALASLDTLFATYALELNQVRHELIGNLTILPGVPQTLDQLAVRGVWQSVLTGNTEAAARVKLECAGLNHHLDFTAGAFGDDHHDRNHLAPMALTRASASRQARLSPAEVVIVGDTPRDIACARFAGARVVAVATGRFSATELATHQPDRLLSSLADTDRTLATLLEW